MKVKYLWILLPIIVVWVSNYIIWNFVSIPATEWWHSPVIFTCVGLGVASFALFVDKLSDE